MADRTHSIRWQPPAGSPVQARGIYLLHGLGEHAARYERLARHLVSLGFRVGAHDHPGHGRSDGRRGLIEPPGSLATQAAIQIMKFACETGTEPVLFGHSLGGLLATELVLDHQLPVAGLMLSAPAIVPRLGSMDRLKLFALSMLAPSRSVELPYDASRLTHDPDEIEKAHADALIHGFKSANLINWLRFTGKGLVSRAATLNVPTLLMIAGSDLVIDISKTRAFASRAPRDLLTLQVYEGYHHEILNETPDRRQRVLVDIDQWLHQTGFLATA